MAQSAGIADAFLLRMSSRVWTRWEATAELGLASERHTMTDQLTEVDMLTLSKLLERAHLLVWDRTFAFVDGYSRDQIAIQLRDASQRLRVSSESDECQHVIDHDGEGFITRKMCEHCEADEHDGPCEQQP